jgi:hypothetical protein
VIGAARQAREAQLREIVFPQADRALLMVSRLVLEYPVTAAGTGIFVEIHHNFNHRPIRFASQIHPNRKTKKGGCPPLFYSMRLI